MGAFVNARDSNKRTALRLACESDQEDDQSVISVLLRFGVKVSAQDSKGETPLHEACWRMNQSVVDTQLRNGAEVCVASGRGRTPLHFVAGVAMNKSTIAIASALLSTTETEEASDGERLGVVNWQDSAGSTALHLASEKNNYELIRVLLRRGANVGVRNSAGKTALHCAAKACAGDIVAVLVDNEEDVNAEDLLGNTPLQLCSSNYNKFAATIRSVAIENLLSMGAVVMEKNMFLKTPCEEITAVHLSSSPIPFQIGRKELDIIEETFIEHVIKQRTMKIHGEVDITWTMGPDFMIS